MSVSQKNTTNCDAPQFIKKLHLMIMEHPDAINFSDDGNEVHILNYPIFTKNLLPEYFRHSHWRSFIRQMNMYQFRKVSRGVHSLIFINPYFKRGNQQNYYLIKRKSHIKQNQLDQFVEVFSTAQEEIEKQFGLTSVSVFLNKIMEMQAETNRNLLQLESSIDVISKQKKNNETKAKISCIREGFQMIQQSSIKLLGSFEKYTKGCQYAIFGGSSIQHEYMKTKGLVIPVIQPQKIPQAPAIKIQECFQGQQKNNGVINPANNLLEVTPGGSFSSFHNLLN